MNARVLHGACALLLCACSRETVEETATELPSAIEIPDPSPRITSLAMVEDLSEAIADRLLSFSAEVRRRDFASAEAWLSDDFAGHGLHALPALERSQDHLDTELIQYDAEAAAILGREDFISGVRALVAPWTRMETVIWKVKGAEFQRGAGIPWGKVKLYVHLTGVNGSGGGEGLVAWGWARAERRAGQWILTRFELTSLEHTRRVGPIFTDVSAAAGLAHVGSRFGQPGNRSFAFNGAACGDVDGDGRWDLFVPSDGRNFLYLGGDQGRFQEVANERGVAGPDGGTGTVLFDFDNDGDQDLAVGHVDDGETEGTRLELYRNDGQGHFERLEGGLGLGAEELVAYSLTVLDYDADGWLDLFVCGYGIVAEEHNNSWIEASNGAPNALFRNLEGQGFEDVADDLGLAGASWTYAASAFDFDADGDSDIYVANDYGTNRLWRNDGGRFVDVAEALGVRDLGNGMGISAGDLSGDGRLDVYVSNMSSTAGNRILNRLQDEVDPELWAALKKAAAGNTIFIANEDGTFSRNPRQSGGLGANWAWSAALADYDLDGYLDVFCTNGFFSGEHAFDT